MLSDRVKKSNAALRAASERPVEKQQTTYELIEENFRPKDALGVVVEEGEGEGESKKSSNRRSCGLKAARLAQVHLEAGIPLCQVGHLGMATLRVAAHVELDVKGGKMKFSRKTVKRLSLGVAHLDTGELINAILGSDYLLIAGDESLRKGDKKFPIFVAFWDAVAGKPWWGLLWMCSMEDKTAETQATLFYETIVDVLKYPRHRVLYVLSNNTASVSGAGGCVTKLQQKLRGVDTTAVVPGRGSGRGRGGRARGGNSERGRGRGATGAGRGRGAPSPSIRRAARGAAARRGATRGRGAMESAGARTRTGRGGGRA